MIFSRRHGGTEITGKATAKGTKNTKMERDRFLIHFVTFVFFVVAFPDAYKQRADRALVLFVFYVLVLWPFGNVS